MPSITLKDVDQQKFVKAFSAFLKKTGKMKVPEWVDLVKSARFKELAPYDEDWYYTRCAALARHIYFRSPVGVGGVTKIFGGHQHNGVCPSHFCRGAGGVARKALQSLEQLKLIERTDGGRKLTIQGRRDLDRIAAQVRPKKQLQPPQVRDFWSESGPADVLARVQRKEITLFRAAEMLNVTVTTLANYLSTLRRGGSSSGDEGADEARDDDAFDDVSMSLLSSTPKKLATAALENNPDITIVKQENTVQMSNHEQQDDDDESQPSSVATNNNADNSESEMGDAQDTNGTTHHEEDK